jgi:hypothetical protein
MTNERIPLRKLFPRGRAGFSLPTPFYTIRTNAGADPKTCPVEI